MKISPKNYAKALVESLDQKSDLKTVAKQFWFILQKNKQYRELDRVLAETEKEYAKKNGLTLVNVYSNTELSDTKLKEISAKVKKSTGTEVVISQKVNPGLEGGMIVKIGDKEIDLSVRGKMERLKNKLTKRN